LLFYATLFARFSVFHHISGFQGAILSKVRGQYSFFDVENQLDKIYQINDFLPKLNTLVDWEIFREPLTLVREKEHKSNAGRPLFDVVLMFKVLVLKSSCPEGVLTIGNFGDAVARLMRAKDFEHGRGLFHIQYFTA